MEKTRSKTSTLSYRRKAIYGCLVTGLFLVSFECVLAALDVESVLERRDPYVGFERALPLFVERVEGGQTFLQTADNKLSFFNAQRFPKHKPDDVTRVFCLGGSTTFGRPFDDRTSFVGWLRELLPLVENGRNWEVINAGGISYASYRVAAVMDELVKYSPDLFVIYTGHNEFLEERTYRDLNESSPRLRRVTAVLLKSRVVSLAHHLLTKGDTRLYDRVVLPQEVDAILDHSVGPDAYERDDQLRKDILEHFKYNLARMIKTARAAGAEVLLVTPSANTKDFSPFKSEHTLNRDDGTAQRWTELVDAAAELQKSGDADGALSMLMSAEEIDSGSADLHFRMGTLRFEKGEYADAGDSFQRAIENDICPLRATLDIRQAVEQTAIAYQVPLVDFDSILKHDCLESFGHASPGREYFLDHVHPTVEIHRLLALAIVEALTQAGIVTPEDQWGEEAIAQASRRIESRIDAELQANALTTLAQVLSWAGKQEEAGPLAEQAVQLRSHASLKEDAEAMFYAAVSHAMKGRDSEAIELLGKVVELQPGNAQAHWRLGVLLYDQLRFQESRFHFSEAVRLNPEDAYSCQMLGVTLMKLGRYQESLSALYRASELAPDNAVIRDNINATLKKVERG